ncbi:MAG TPA: metal ABC transporter substrate-binding protein, partial [Dehalococcoidia bacterium]|nr:metal ABC transporter substrate-binding protein [Dehalococcoidia bacterium]
LLVLVALALVGVAASCGASSNGSDGGEVRVVTSLRLFADFIQHVGGDRVQVTALVPADADPHTYEPVPSQVAKVADADLVVVNGLGLEQTLHDLIYNNVGGDVPVVQMSDGLSTLAGNAQEGETVNPHVWLNVQNAMHYVESVRDGLIAVDPAGAGVYRSNAASYLAELDALDKETAAAIQTIPPERRKLVTFHDAYSYLGQRYGLEIVGFVLESEGREASAKDLANLADEIRAQHVPAVFGEPEFNPRLLETVAEEAGVQVRQLLSDAYTENVHSYVDLMRFNAQQLVKGLGLP